MSKWLPGVLTKARMPTVKTKQCGPKLFGSQARFVCEAKCAGNHTRDSGALDGWMRKRGGGQSRNRSRWSDCQTDSRYSKAADESCAYQKRILVQRKRAPESVDGKVVDENAFPPGQGYLPKLVTKMNEMPTTFVSLVVKRNCSDGAWPFLPLWEFRAANCFRDLIVAWQNENPRWSGLSYLNRITGTRRSVSKGRIMLVPFAPLECKGIRSVSRRWWSFQNLWWSQLLTSVHNSISQN